MKMLECGLMEKLWAEHKMLLLSLPNIFPHQKQYPLKSNVKEGLKPITENLKDQGLFIPCDCPYNTPILGVKKQMINGDYFKICK